MPLAPQVDELLAPLRQGLDRADVPGYSLAAYGSVVRDGFDWQSDAIHLALVVERLSSATLRKLSEPIRNVSRRGRVLVFLCEASELARMADCFSVKLLEIRRHHVMLHGVDPFESLRIDSAHVRVRLEQELRNHLARLRHAYMLGGDSVESLAHAIFVCTRSIWVECDTLLYLLGEAPESKGDVLAAVAARVDLPLPTLEGLSKPVPFSDVPRAFLELLGLVERLTAFVDHLEVRVP